MDRPRSSRQHVAPATTFVQRLPSSMKDPRPQSPIFVKTYNFLLWIIPLTLKFPKSQRFLLAERLSSMGLDFYDLILDAVMEPNLQSEHLDQADKLLTKIRLYVRLSHDLQCISPKQFEHAARLMDELGRLLGGWKRKLASTKKQ
ncbi:MAG: diversity-generating retroelement protein Avd [Candidatus Lokiarchaeota archaeon]|nr:diversity-generating retroelement protein Avd [Candidatus Lokiarchaeota archaeon]